VKGLANIVWPKAPKYLAIFRSIKRRDISFQLVRLMKRV